MFSAELAIFFNFMLNNFWSFKDKKIIGGFFVYLIKFITFNFVSSGSIIIQGVGLSLALKFLEIKLFTFLKSPTLNHGLFIKF